MSIQARFEQGEGGVPRFHWSLDEKAHKEFERFGVVHELTAGEPIFEADRPSDALYIVLEGQVVILDKSGRELARLSQNHSFGEMGLLLGRPRSADAWASTDSRVLALSRSDLDHMVAESPVWAARLYRVLAECLAEYLAAANERSRTQQSR